MSSRCRDAARVTLFALAAGALAACASPAAQQEPSASTHDRELRVCADPDNLPFSDERRAGFENRVADIVADAMHARVVYAWHPVTRGWVRKTLGAGLCDVLLSVPDGLEDVDSTVPYYASVYAFVQRADTAPVTSLDDARLRSMRVAVPLVPDDLVASPPGYALASRAIVANVEGYAVTQQHAAEHAVHDVARGALDVAIVWGPQAGYFARRESPRLDVSPLPSVDPRTSLPLSFVMSMGVKPGNAALKHELDRAIEARRAEIDRVLVEFAVPRARGASVAEAPR